MKNTELFNNMVKNYDPILPLLLQNSNDNTKNGKHTNQSYLQALIQDSGDMDVLVNTLENHPSIFTYSEVYQISLDVIKEHENTEFDVFETRAVKSWFSFSSESIRSEWMEDVKQIIDNSDEKEAFYDKFLHSATYKETFEILLQSDSEESEDMDENKSQSNEQDLTERDRIRKEIE